MKFSDPRVSGSLLKFDTMVLELNLMGYRLAIQRKNYLRTMPNTYFQFKQFLINQEKSGMKVTTDGCLFGAWVADQIKNQNPKRILDIGTGTGLLSLMLAQVAEDSQIDALEINKNAFLEAQQNFAKSPWSNRLKCVHTSLQEYTSHKKYDLIICNPPFFKDNFKGLQSDKNQAIHSDLLSINELIDGIKLNLKEGGKSFILYPENETKTFTKQALKQDLYLNQKVIVRNRENDSVFRVIGLFSFQQMESIKSEIIIRNSNNHYTDQFKKLIEEYYL